MHFLVQLGKRWFPSVLTGRILACFGGFGPWFAISSARLERLRESTFGRRERLALHRHACLDWEILALPQTTRFDWTWDIGPVPRDLYYGPWHIVPRPIVKAGAPSPCRLVNPAICKLCVFIVNSCKYKLGVLNLDNSAPPARDR